MKYSLTEINKLIKENNFSFKKHFGQNFLIDDNILNNIVDKALIDNDTLVIEIGPGAGALTSRLAEKAKNVIAYEIDNTLKALLNKTVDNNNVEIIYDDFLKRNIENDLLKYEYKKLYVVANLPYYITTPIINKIIDDKLSVDKIVVMIQKEVADRFLAKPSSKQYNSLTIFINYFYNVSKLFLVSKNVFMPKPNVDSMVIQLDKRSIKKVNVLNEQLFFKLVRDSFSYKRKTLKNNLREYNLLKIEEALKKYNLDLNVRAEALSIDVFADIANNISQ
jgi:16S rRNA (adenine1518-N6/adenine1519-N6)-dimethyltransferase